MFTERADPTSRARAAFTLLEIVMAVAILGMMALAIYRFVSVNLTALRISSEQSVEDARYRGLLDYLTYELQNLPPPVALNTRAAIQPAVPASSAAPGTPQENPLATGETFNFGSTRAVLSGEPFKFGGHSRDEINWISGAGAGVLTRYAVGDWRVSLRLRPMTKGSDKLEIGLARSPFGSAETTPENESWVPLLSDVQSMEIRYFDPRLNAWIDKWTDTTVLPRLVRFTIGRGESFPLWEAIVALGRTPL